MSYQTIQIGVTGPAGKIGSGTEGHIDTKIRRGTDWADIVSRFDSKAGRYKQDGRNIIFSNAGVHGEIYNPDASLDEKIALLQRVDNAHSHSVHKDFHSFDFYAPIGTKIGGESDFGAPIYVTGKPGRSAHGDTGGGYGNYGYVLDDSGNVITKSGHGNIDHAVFKGGTFGGSADSNLDSTGSNSDGDAPSQSTPQQEAVERTQNYANMSKAELDAAYDGMRNDPDKASIEGMKMHNAYFGKK